MNKIVRRVAIATASLTVAGGALLTTVSSASAASLTTTRNASTHPVATKAADRGHGNRDIRSTHESRHRPEAPDADRRRGHTHSDRDARVNPQGDAWIYNQLIGLHCRPPPVRGDPQARLL